MMKIAATVFVACMAVFWLCREMASQGPKDTPMWIAAPGGFAFVGMVVSGLGWAICNIWDLA